MGAWVRYSRERLTYTGRISRAPFTAWMQTSEGRATVDEAASGIGFALFGKTRAAGRRLWRQLADAARDGAVVEAVQIELQTYLKRLGALAYSDGLPREGVQLRRLVIVPCVLLNGDAYSAMEMRLRATAAFTALQGGKALRDFFILQLIDELSAAVVRARPTMKSPLPAGQGWLTVGVNPAFDWRLPMMNEPAWAGHHYVLELTREPVTRALRKAVAEAVARLEALLPTLSRVERNEILRRARYVA
jgi:hypothetical protein